MKKTRISTHPSKDITGTEGNELEGTKIVLCITGSVAAYKAIDLTRLLIRHGADVYAVMTEPAASMLLSPEVMKWATGNDVITKLTGNLEHIMHADYGMSDLIIVYPCTANTIGKMASGIDDTPVTSVLSVALGSKIPVIVAPAMHMAMYENKFIQQNVQKLRDHVTFIRPILKEGKAKVAEPAQILDVVKSILLNGPLSGKRLLVTAGSTIEYIDPIRVITNLSSGKMGIAIAQEAERMGGSVTLVYGHGSQEPPNDNVIRVSTSEEMHKTVISELSSSTKKYDIVIMAAAVADFTPRKKSDKKIDTRAGNVELSLVATRKLVDEVKKNSKNTFLVAFKADYKVSDSVLINKAYEKLQECSADLVVANDLGRKGIGASSDNNEVFIVGKDNEVLHLPLESKSSIARKLLEIVVRKSAGDKVSSDDKHVSSREF
ncbi:MAG TPA: bifunctional phosphopantothenoylcysteine decarboxylase/phosphopantothenate--cysteine ligase CoaBC [Nitrososphaera sp.]|nr:bifunctional phosphopantothenoylcysteine decarboxylase/phosphopantothenate--cysteine ligase CoaBC [Nitrososphaera sp.]